SLLQLVVVLGAYRFAGSSTLNQHTVRHRRVVTSAETAREGGYQRIHKFGLRAGVNPPMAYVELVDRATAGEAVSAE
ncbi:hypothetical protein ACIOWJ_18400, partial [Pseudomonas sivasensis]